MSGLAVTTNETQPLVPLAAAVAVPLDAWLEPALALPLIEIAIDVTIRTPVSVSSPACAVVRGLIGQRLRDLRCLTGAPRSRPFRFNMKVLIIED